MGVYIIDQYSLLHFATGVVAYFLGFSFTSWFIGHALFEISENSNTGIYIINQYLLWFWPGGKPKADSLENIISDQIFSSIGWIVAQQLDQYGIKNNWYI